MKTACSLLLSGCLLFSGCASQQPVSDEPVQAEPLREECLRAREEPEPDISRVKDYLLRTGEKEVVSGYMSWSRRHGDIAVSYIEIPGNPLMVVALAQRNENDFAEVESRVLLYDIHCDGDVEKNDFFYTVNLKKPGLGARELISSAESFKQALDSDMDHFYAKALEKFSESIR